MANAPDHVMSYGVAARLAAIIAASAIEPIGMGDEMEVV